MDDLSDPTKRGRGGHKTHINALAIRKLRRALDASERIESAALSGPCLAGVKKYVDPWICEPLREALAIIDPENTVRL